MEDEQRGVSNVEKFESKAQPQGTSHAEGSHRENTGENARNDRRQSGEGSAPQPVSLAPPLSSVSGSGDAKAPWRDDARAPEARATGDHSAHITSTGSRTRTHAYSIGGRPNMEKNEQHAVEGDRHRAALGEAENSVPTIVTKEEQEVEAVKKRLDVFTVHAAQETSQTEEQNADGAVGGALCTACGTRANDGACSGCGKECYRACGADSQGDADACALGLPGGCGVDGNSGTENFLREKGVKPESHKQTFVNALGVESRTELTEKTRSNGYKHGHSDRGGAEKTEDAEKFTAHSATCEAGGGELHADTRVFAPKGRPRSSPDIVDDKSLREKPREDGKAEADPTGVGTGSASTADVKAEPIGRMPEGSAESVTGHTCGVDSGRIPAKGDNPTSPTKNNAYAQEGVALAGQDAKHADEKGTLAVHGSHDGETRDKSTSAGSESSADTSATESSKYGSGSGQSADASISGLSASKGTIENKQGFVVAQERRGSGAEDEEEEEEEAELIHGGLSGGSEKKEYMASRKRGAGETMTRTKPTSPRSLSPSPCQYRRKRRRADNGAVATRCKVNVGPRHQVPALPPFFLDSSCLRDPRADRLPETRELYNHDTGDTARLVYSPFAMQRVYRRRLAEGTTDEGGIRHADEMNDFIRKVAENWTNKAGWQPFSPEYAYKLLHFAGYDPQRALRIMKDSRFCFTTICDPPQRRYDNKWRPKDRRGQIATHPYPSPLTLRAYLSRKSQHAAATAAADNTHSHG